MILKLKLKLPSRNFIRPTIPSIQLHPYNIHLCFTRNHVILISSVSIYLNSKLC